MRASSDMDILCDCICEHNYPYRCRFRRFRHYRTHRRADGVLKDFVVLGFPQHVPDEGTQRRRGRLAGLPPSGLLDGVLPTAPLFAASCFPKG